MKNPSRYFLRPLVATLAAAAVVLLTGCATSVGVKPEGYESSGDGFRYNGLTLVKMNRSDSGVADDLIIRTKADKAAADNLIKFYDTKAWWALKSGDTQAFVVARHLGAKVARARLEQSLATDGFLYSLASKKDGSAAIPAGGSVYLPDNVFDSTMKPNGKKRADAEDFIELMESYAAVPVSVQGGVAVAAAGELFGALGALGSAARSLKNDQDERTAKMPSLGSLQVGDAYAARDSAGNRYFVERTPDGIVLHNPGNSPQVVNLDQLKYMPTLEAPSQLRKDAARIVANINDAHDVVLREGLSRGRGFGVWSVAPNVIYYAGGGSRYFLDVQGRKSMVDEPEARTAYKTNPAYKLAVDMTDDRVFSTPMFVAFRNQYCKGGGTLHEYNGANMNKRTFACLDGRGNVTYSKTFLVDNEFNTQSWNSLLNDKRMVDELKGIEDKAKTISAIAAFIPGVGNVDGATKCAGLPALTTMTYRYTQNRDGRYDQLKQYVGDLIPAEDSPSAVATSLDCAQAVGGFGIGMNGISKGARKMKIDSTFASDDYKRTAEALKLFDTNLVARYSLPDALSLVQDKMTSSNALMMFKGFYDSAQNMNNLSALASAIATN